MTQLTCSNADVPANRAWVSGGPGREEEGIEQGIMRAASDSRRIGGRPLANAQGIRWAQSYEERQTRQTLSISSPDAVRVADEPDWLSSFLDLPLYIIII